MDLTAVLTPEADCEEKTKTRKQPPYAVIVLNDNRHTYAFVTSTFQKVLGISKEKAYLLADKIHHEGQAIVWSGSKEVAELKEEQIRSCGPDFHANPPVKFPLGVHIEPLPG